MKIPLLIAVARILGSCMTPQQQTQRMSSTSLCYFQAAGNPQQQHYASMELSGRSTTCNPAMIEMGWREVQASRQNQAVQGQQMNDLAARLLTQQPQVAPPAPQINCYSSPSGNGTVTTCR